MDASVTTIISVIIGTITTLGAGYGFYYGIKYVGERFIDV